MKDKDFEIYREGHLEGYEIGLRDGAYVQKALKIFSEGFIVGLISGMGILTLILIICKIGGLL